MIWSLAWRNLWRNRRRTFITAASIMFAVLFASAMTSLQKGAWNHMVNNVVNFYYGFAQIQDEGYQEDQSLDLAFTWDPEKLDLSDHIDGLYSTVPRLESFALASHGEKSSGILLIGTDPERENELTGLSRRVVEGSYLSSGDKAVLPANGLKEVLNIELGDTLVLISQGYQGSNAAGKYEVKGFVNFGSPELNKSMIFMPLPEAQWFYNTDDKITTATLHIKDETEVDRVVSNVQSNLPEEGFRVLDWKELIPELLQAKALDEAGGLVVILILYLIISFGIFGTILKMASEREYEFGVLISIGMRRGKLALLVWLEMIFIGIIGAIAGIMISIPIVAYFQYNPIRFTGDYAKAYEKFGVEPILPAQLDANILLMQASFVFLITSVLALYPYLKIKSLKPVQALRA